MLKDIKVYTRKLQGSALSFAMTKALGFTESGVFIMVHKNGDTDVHSSEGKFDAYKMHQLFHQRTENLKADIIHIGPPSEFETTAKVERFLFKTAEGIYSTGKSAIEAYLRVEVLIQCGEEIEIPEILIKGDI